MGAFFLEACLPPAEAIGASQSPRGKTVPVATGEWDTLVTDAQKEGTVNIYATFLGPAQQPLTEAFKKRFGINLQFINGIPAEITAKILAERRGGIYNADIGHFGETTALMDVKPLNLLVPLTDLLILPEVKDPSKWIGGQLPFLDNEHTVFAFMAMSGPPGCYNTNMVKEGELTSFMDILRPKYKGKIVFQDPTISGTSINFLSALTKAWGRERALEVFRQLAAQEPLIIRDKRFLVEGVARAKYLIGLGQDPPVLQVFLNAGAPLKAMNLKEPRHVSGGPGNVMIFNKNPHPKATQLYLNWILSKEASAIWSKEANFPSRREDLASESLLDPIYTPRSNDVFPDEEHLQLRVQMRKVATDIFGSLLK